MENSNKPKILQAYEAGCFQEYSEDLLSNTDPFIEKSIKNYKDPFMKNLELVVEEIESFQDECEAFGILPEMEEY